jgi:hypothetical protein
MPHAAKEIKIQDFPVDEKGPHFAVPGSQMQGQTLKFHVRHLKRSGQISIFITCSIVGGTGNGMILDMAALIRDIFKDHWPIPRIYGILVLPSAFKRVVYNRNARANAYSALKEIDYFMSGNSFIAQYPSGHKVNIKERLFNDGMLYLLDVENMASNSLQGRDQVQELTGQFIATFVASTVGGAIEERMVNDSTRASVFLPKSKKSPRRASYNSFGISRVVYPVPQLRDLGYKMTAKKMIDSYIEEINPKLLLETLGDLNRGIVRALRMNCILIFERMYPDYKMDTDVEFRSYRLRMKKAIDSKDARKVLSLLENIKRDYGKSEIEKIKSGLLRRMDKKSEIELKKINTILFKVIYSFLKDPKRGFIFAEAVLNLLLEKLELYQKKYYQEKVGLSRYSDEAFDGIIENLEKKGLTDPKQPDAFIEMADFNYKQLVFEVMLQASENFIRQFKVQLYQMKNNEIHVLKDKLIALREELDKDIREIRFELLEKKNPLFFYLINDDEITEFLEKYFEKRLSLDDLCEEIDYVKMDKEDDAMQIIETYLIFTEGLSILERPSGEIKELIEDRYGAILDKDIDEIKRILYGQDEPGDQEGLLLSDTTVLKIDIENIKKKLFKIINKRFKGLNFENISLKQLLDAKKIPVKRLLEKLDHYSRPYIYLNANDLAAMEYYRTVTNFALNTYEEGEDPESAAENDLPSRLNHYKKRSQSIPNISVETFVVPNLCKPYEIISIGILLGYPLYKLDSLESASRDYHHLVAEKSHPLHLFNNPLFDAKYFPDPFRKQNYLNPSHLWQGLIALKILLKTKSGYQFEPAIQNFLKDTEARENYREVVLNIEKKVKADKGWKSISADLLAHGVAKLALMARNPVRKTLQFRKEYSLAIRDILDGDDTADKAKAKKMTKQQYIQKYIENPQFQNMEELVFFLDNETGPYEFLRKSVHDIVRRTKENVEAGAVINLPSWKKSKTRLPVFKDRYAFYDYFERRGSLEWQNLLKTRLVVKLNKTVSSSRFRLESDPTLPDRRKITLFLDKLTNRMPEIVLWEVKAMNKIIS